ncbi:MAG TPA: class I SAM-dependent methyltransferase [Dehalococcoidia bacterium]|nr:class I SAM-dependent methyltransferase [Dehalococcoidia bacterium]
MEKREQERTRSLERTHWWFAGMRDVMAALLDRYCDGPVARALDAGGGTGGNFPLLNDRARAVFAVDLSPVATGYYHEQTPAVVRASVNSLPFASHSFDLIACIDVMGQLPEDEAPGALAELQRVLRPGGTLLLRTAAYRWLASAHDDIVATRCRYTRQQVEARLRQAGLQPLRLSYVTTILFPLVVLRRLWLKLPWAGESDDLVALPGPLNALLRGILRIEAWLIRRVDLPFGLSVLCLAKKPDVAAA